MPVACETHVLTFIERFAPLASNYDVLLCDVWGVVHNGVAAFTEAADALARFRARGGTVIFITNAPYPADAVQRFLDRLGVRRDAYDAIISSGDVTRSIVENEARRARVPSRPATRPADLRRPQGHLRSGRERRLRGLLRSVRRQRRRRRRTTATCWRSCAVVRCSWSAPTPTSSSSAATRSSIALEPWPTRMSRLAARRSTAASRTRRSTRRRSDKAAAFRGGEVPPLARVLAIGDSVSTDLEGAAAFGVDCLFVISGLHADQFGLCEAPDVAGVFAAADAAPKCGHSPTCVVSVRLIFEHHCVRVRDDLPASFPDS